MAHIAINISEPYTFDKIMSASELMLYTNISNYLVDGVDMNTILSALAEFTDDAIFHPVIISQENMFQEWNGVNYVDTVKATGQNIEVEIGDNKVISSLEYGPGEWIIQDIQTDDGTVRGLEWKNIYPSVDRYYKNENEEWQPIDNDDYHENVKYVFHSLQPRGIKRIKIENGDFTDGNSIDLYKSFDSENQGYHLSVNLDSKRETFALRNEGFSINTIEEGQISEEGVSSVLLSTPRCDSSALYNSGNNIFSNIVGRGSFILAATDDEYVDYSGDNGIEDTIFNGDYKGGTMSFTGLLDINIKNIGIHKIENGEKIEGVINNINIFDNILCLYSRSSSLLKDADTGFMVSNSFVSKLGKNNLISNNLELNWSDNTRDIVNVFIKNYNMYVDNEIVTNHIEKITPGTHNILDGNSINNKCVGLDIGVYNPYIELIDGIYSASIEISSDVDYALLCFYNRSLGDSGTRVLKLSYNYNEKIKSIEILEGDVIEYSKTNGCMILNRYTPRIKNATYKYIDAGSVDTILSGSNKFMLYSHGQTYIEEGEEKYSAYITIDENVSSVLLYYGDETNRPPLKVFYGPNSQHSIALGPHTGLKIYKWKYGDTWDWSWDHFNAHRLPSFISYNFELGIKSQDTELSYTVDSVNGSVTLVPTNINTFGRMREYSIPEYAVHSIEGGGETTTHR